MIDEQCAEAMGIDIGKRLEPSWESADRTILCRAASVI